MHGDLLKTAARFIALLWLGLGAAGAAAVEFASAAPEAQSPWRLGVFAGPMETPFDGHLHTGGFAADDHVQLGRYGGSIGVDVRYVPRVEPMLGAQPFAFAGYVRYLGTEVDRRSLDMHPVPAGSDSGLRVRETQSLALGVGGTWNTAHALALELAFGVHATRVQAHAFSDDAAAGGETSFDGAKTMVGTLWQLGVTHPVASLASGRTVYGVVRWTGTFLRGMSFSGRSPAADYNARIDSGWNHVLQVGLLL